mgnify:CR=1 FL=1
MLKCKKGSSDGSAVFVIIIIIALFMVLYILFVPPDVRQDILEGNNESAEKSEDSERQELLAESPGSVFPTKTSITVHKLSDMNLFLKTEPKITNLASSITVKKSMFAKSSPTLKFSLNSLSDTNSANLFFSVSRASGELRVKLNGNTIYAEEIQSSGIKVIELPKSYLEKNNELEFSVSTGIFASNVYSLKDIGVKQEFELRNAEESRTFSVSESEKKDAESVVLSFRQFCNEKLESGVTDFKILLNEKDAFRKKISCLSTEESVELKSSLLVEGTNTISFRIDEGDFLFSTVEIRTKSKDSSFPSYTFTLSDKNFEKVKDNEKDITLILLLEDNKETKSARIEINSDEIFMRTESGKFELNLRDYVVDGTNFLRIIPSKTFTITGLKVVLE